MKRRLIVVLTLVFPFCLAQSQESFVPGEVIIKFKDDYTSVNTKPKNGRVTTGIAAFDRVAEKYQFRSSRQVFANRPVASYRAFRAPDGTTIKPGSLNNIVHFTLDNVQKDKVMELIQELRNNPAVDYAEPNILLKASDVTYQSAPLSEAELKAYVEQDARNRKQEVYTAVRPNDPSFNTSGHHHQIGADEVWNQTTGDSSMVIGILDTGVDWLHPDLNSNVFVNWVEKNGVSGVDDDRNGYVDDIRGWDFINQDNDPMDDNGHGTHVAGLAAAVGNNGIGVTGVVWQAKLMPIKVLQATGSGTLIQVAQGVEYAARNGAKIINMSLGTTMESPTLRSVLENAYATTLIVASAGNNGICIGPGLCPDMQLSVRNFPGAYSFVLGVEDRPTPPYGYSNYDQDGPLNSKFPELYNYDVAAPGTNLLSTWPQNTYRASTGTSMSAPVAAGAAALYMRLKPNNNKEQLFGDLINTSEAYLNVYNALNAVRKPILSFAGFSFKDTLVDGNGDDKADAGESLSLKVKIRNMWGTADSVYAVLGHNFLSDTSKVELTDSVAFLSAIADYASQENTSDALTIKLKSSVANNTDLILKLNYFNKQSRESLGSQDLVLRVYNGIELIGQLDTTRILTADKNWIVKNSFRINSSGVLILQPGTTLTILRDITNNGTIKFEGTKENSVTVTGTAAIMTTNLNDSRIYGSYVNFKDITVEQQNPSSSTYFISTGYLYLFKGSFNNVNTPKYYALIQLSEWSQSAVIKYCQFKNILINKYIFYSSQYMSGIGRFKVEGSNFDNIKAREVFNYPNNSGDIITGYTFPFKALVLSNCNINFLDADFMYRDGVFQNTFMTISNQTPDSVMNTYNILYNPNYFIRSMSAEYKPVHNLSGTYFGTSKENKIKDIIFDFYDYSSLAELNFKPIRTKPLEQAPGCVWKVVVNNKDAQDEYEQLDPLGVGSHKFEVYFNKAMDTKYAPKLSLGVRDPYNQIAVTDSAHWSADSTIYTAYLKVSLSTPAGIHTIRVQEAVDTSGMEIPIEKFRFRVNVQPTSSQADNFRATAGFGKISLSWEKPETGIADLLGYKIYRAVSTSDTTYSEFSLLNSNKLIADTAYVDYDVLRGKRYQYKYTILRTNFEETDTSKLVMATPLVPKKGDANGDLTVNIQDVVTEVNYILGNDPKPFLYEASDVNSDATINVLDVTGTVSIIMNPSGNSFSNAPGVNSGAVIDLRLKSDTLWLFSNGLMSGLQWSADAAAFRNWVSLEGLAGFEKRQFIKGGARNGLWFHPAGGTLPQGQWIPIALIDGSLKGAQWVASNHLGQAMSVRYEEVTGEITQVWSLAVMPNPSSGLVRLQYTLPAGVQELNWELAQNDGRIVSRWRTGTQSAGRYTVEKNFTRLPNGVYHLVLNGTDINGKKLKSITSTTVIIK